MKDGTTEFLVSQGITLSRNGFKLFKNDNRYYVLVKDDALYHFSRDFEVCFTLFLKLSEKRLNKSQEVVILKEQIGHTYD